MQYSINAMGDPELPIYTEDPASFTNVSVTVNGSSVTVSTGGINSGKICLSSVDNGLSYYEVESNDSSHTFTNVTKPYYVTITKHNYIPYTYPEDIYLQNTTFTEDCSIEGNNIYAGNNVTNSLPQGDVIIQNGGKVVIDADQNVTIEGGFECALGGTLEIK